ncbi:hypothetical protein BDP81DRAFT_68841 [Colletotrichum phormii]|uniref:Uncharacterized protein n=1 Tax=Colletotrichum phormii TaxID=359342 RepID=A0AAI9ZMF8_9PEZI|nr:uncharacterized protein BDP81DRAFT_68841 [Colletotrichum phormii]KAK1633618.1 hypothetical protein BDP81DRAFT_68841 [Colletotrichum phormii]
MNSSSLLLGTLSLPGRVVSTGPEPSPFLHIVSHGRTRALHPWVPLVQGCTPWLARIPRFSSSYRPHLLVFI